jgi:hypothetical protein
MRILEAGLTMLLFAPLVGCTWHTTKPAAVPPPAKPVVVLPPPPEPNLSAPQTAVVLPSPQPVNPGAIPKVPVPEKQPVEKAEAPVTLPKPTPKKASTASVPPGGQPKPEESDPEVPPAPVVAEQQQIRPILTAEEQNRINGLIEANRKETSDRLNKAKGKPEALVERINSYKTQAEDAQKRGDYAQADALMERAAIMARDLPE